MRGKSFIRVGLLVATSILVVFWGLNYLKGRNFLRQEKDFYAEYSKIGNLVESSPVTLNGFQVGQVRKIDLSKNNPGKIIVKMILTYPGIELPRGTVAKVYSTDLMGTKGVALLMTHDSLMHVFGDTLIGSIEDDIRDQVNAQMLPLKQKAEGLIASMDSVLFSFQLILNEQSRKSLTESFSSVNNTLGNLEQTSLFLEQYVKIEAVKVSALLSTIDSISNSLNSQVSDLRGFLTNLRDFSDTLAQVPIIEAVNSFNLVLSDLHQLSDNLNRGEGSLGQLLVNDSLYESLVVASNSLNRLIEDVRVNPGRYVKVSLIDRAKTFYTDDDHPLAKIIANQGTNHFYVCITQSESPLSHGHEDLGPYPDADYIQVGQLYYYYVFRHKYFDRARRKTEKVKRDLPWTGIYTWVDGSWTRLRF